MPIKIIAGGVLGAVVGGVFGYIAKCKGGTCPLTCNPIGGVIFGALIGSMLATSIGGGIKPFKRSDKLIQLSAEDGLSQVLATNPVVLVDFYADWCGPCRRMEPVINALADAYTGRVAVVAVNVDTFRGLAETHGVEEIPDVRIFRDGKETKKLVGLRRREFFEKTLGELLEAKQEGTAR